MGIEHLFNWYQKKIARYDKQRWETRIEQTERRIIGLNHIRMRSTTPNTNLIDLDLVRGSSFAKAKPQHGFLTVAKLATLRLVLFPLYCKWWLQHTSPHTFVLILILYVIQAINITVHAYGNTSCVELVVPSIMMWILSLIHSQIVATHHGIDAQPGDGVKARQFQRRRRNAFRKQRGADGAAESEGGKGKKLQFNDVVRVANVERRRSHFHLQRHQHDDDGFESLNGNGSRTSEEEPANVGAGVNLGGERNGAEDVAAGGPRKKGVSWIESQIKRRIASTDSESDKESDSKEPTQPFQRRNSRVPIIRLATNETDDEVPSSSGIRNDDSLSVSVHDYTGITTNSEDCSITDTDTDDVGDVQDAAGCDNDLATTGILNSASVKVSCIIWERESINKADLSMLDISSAIIGRVDAMPERLDYFYIGMAISACLALLPVICLFCSCNGDGTAAGNDQYTDMLKNISVHMHNLSVFDMYKNVGFEMVHGVAAFVFSIPWFDKGMLIIASLQRFILAALSFFLLAVAERTFKQRFLYAKLFSHLTSSRRARKSELPHFRLNKVRNIKTWLSVRSYLKKRGPQRSVDVIVSTSFAVCLLLLIFLCFELLKETINFSQYYLEAMIWCLGLGIFLLRFMTLGTKINKKYRNLSVLITEQINLHLQIEQTPHKKEELNVANNVLKLAIDLLKELESPFKISGLSANPILYNVTKLIILSALSGVLSEMLGFKLKLHKIKLK